MENRISRPEEIIVSILCNYKKRGVKICAKEILHISTQGGTYMKEKQILIFGKAG